MTSERITPPAALAVSLASAKDTLRIDMDDTSLDGLITLWIKGVTQEAEHATGRAFVSQKWRVTLDSFPAAIRLARAPAMSVESVKFYDQAGQLQTLDPADYYADIVSQPGYIVPGIGKAWPSTQVRANAVTVDITCGYGPDSTTTPECAALYILARLAEQWEPASKEFKGTVQSDFIGGLLDPIRTYG
jgi:uncharacterized phiE125 gp8 family phage protein